MSWLTEVTKQHAELEAPQSFYYWSALAALSAVLKDSVWMDRQGVYNLYPNIYVMLHADSGLKKGPPVNMAKKLVTYVNNTYVISGRSSVQGILKKMGTAETKPGGKIETFHNVFICSSELTSSLVEDKAALDIFTDLYDRNYHGDGYESLLKMENYKIKPPVITMLTATNEAHSDEFFVKKDTQGGFFARTFIVKEEKRNRINSLMDPLQNKIDLPKLAEYLKEVAKLKGQFEPTPTSTPVGRFYDEWYHSLMNAIDAQEVKDPTGTLNRFGDSVLKVALLLSVAHEPTMTISLKAMEEAITVCEKLIGAVRQVTIGRGKSNWAQEKGLIIRDLAYREGHIMSRVQLNKKYWMRATSSELDDIMISLEAAGVVQIMQNGAQKYYQMKPDVAKEWQAQFEGKVRKKE